MTKRLLKANSWAFRFSAWAFFGSFVVTFLFVFDDGRPLFPIILQSYPSWIGDLAYAIMMCSTVGLLVTLFIGLKCVSKNADQSNQTPEREQK